MSDPPSTSQLPSSFRPRLSDAFSDELRKSVHQFETTREGRSSLNQRPRLSHAFADELRQSVHKLETTKANKYLALQRPKLSNAFTDELRKSVHDRQKKTQKRGFFGRPKLSEAFTDELRRSVHDLKEKSSKKRGGLFGGFFGRKPNSSSNAPSGSKPIMSPVNEQNTPSTSRRGKLSLNVDQVEKLDLSPIDYNNKSPKKNHRTVVVKSPIRSPKTPSRSQLENVNANGRKTIEVRQNGHEKSTRQEDYNIQQQSSRGEDRQQAQSSYSREISRADRTKKPKPRSSVLQQKNTKLPEMDESLASFASFSAEISYTRSNTDVPSKNSSGKRGRSDRGLTSHSTSFHDDTSYLETKSAVSDLFSRVEGRQSLLSGHSRHTNRSILHEESPTLDEDEDLFQDLLLQTEGDIEAYRKEWIRLIKEKKSLKYKLATSRARNILLVQQVDDLTAQSKDLKRKVNHWKQKTSKLTEQQRAERIKFDNSTDLVTRARVELTKATSENSKLKQRNYDLETSVSTKERVVADLHDTITRQADIIHKLSNKLKDQETTLRLSDDEKRRLEDELAVMISQREGDEMRETFRQLEEDREKFFWQREMDIEAKRIELEKQRDWILEQDAVRHEKDMERLAQDANREIEIEKERDSIQQLITQQLEEMKVANRELRDKFARERNEIAGEINDKENDIAQLEREILGMQKQLSKQDRFMKEVALSKAEAKSAKDDLRDMKRHKLILEKEILNLKKKLKKGGKDPDGWREIIFPGYRGVSFGSKDSESLAGFLTILVEEKHKKSSKAKKAGIDLGRIAEEGERKRTKKKKKESKYKKTYQTTTKKKKRSSNKQSDKSSHKKVKKKEHKKNKIESSKTKSKKSKRGKRGWEWESKQANKATKSTHKSRPHNSIYIGNNMTLDENLELMLRETMDDRSGIDIDDASMLVFKRNHQRQDTNRRSSSYGPSKHRSRRERSFSDTRRRSRSNPPPEIILQ